MSDHRAHVTWTGDLKEGSGEVRADSGAFASPVRLKTRVEQPTKGETTPEELIAGAHAICYSMMVQAMLGKAGHSVERLETEATVTVDKVDGGLKISRSALSVRAHGPSAGLDSAKFREVANDAEAGCPVSNALRGNVTIDLDARLLQDET